MLPCEASAAAKNNLILGAFRPFVRVRHGREQRVLN